MDDFGRQYFEYHGWPDDLQPDWPPAYPTGLSAADQAKREEKETASRREADAILQYAELDEPELPPVGDAEWPAALPSLGYSLPGPVRTPFARPEGDGWVSEEPQEYPTLTPLP